jgi:uncharacterized membrane protein YjfL (UPF0719 family)
MNELGLVAPFWVIVLIWLAKVVLLAFISGLLALLGVRVFDVLTPHIPHRERLGEDLVIHGAITALTAVTAPIVFYIFDFRTWGLLAISFVVSLLIGVALFYIMDKLTPKIPFTNIKQNPVAVGVHVFGYLVFFGLILHAALTGPL